jgi:hypothetical protein
MRPLHEERISSNQQSPGRLLNQDRECRGDVTCDAGVKNMDPQPQHTSGRLHLLGVGIGIRIGGIGKVGDRIGVRHELMQELQLFSRHRIAEATHARQIAARSVEARSWFPLQSPTGSGQG